MLSGVDELHMDGAAACHCVFGKQVAEARYQRCQERMGLGREVAADEQRFLRLAQIVAGGLGDRVEAALGQIGAQHPDGCQPEVDDEEIGDHQHGDQLPGTVPGGGRVVRPADMFEGIDVEADEDAHDGQIIDKVAQVDHAAGDGGKARTAAQQLEDFCATIGEETGEQIGTDEVEEGANQRGGDQADDLGVTLNADVEADGDIGGSEKERGDIAAGHRPPVQRPHETDGHGQTQGKQQGQRHQGQAGQELAEHQGQWGDGGGQQELKGSRPFFLGPHAHGYRRGQEDKEDRHPGKEGPHLGHIGDKEPLDPEKDKEGHRQEDADKDKSDRRTEKGGELLLGNTENGGHWSLLP